MKPILRIARTELASLFFSPIAWLLLIVFILQTSNIFINLINMLSDAEYAGYGGVDKLTTELFSGRGRVFNNVEQNLYYYIPLLTMGLIARELHSGSIKLLQSSPIRLSHIIIGKYLAIVGYFSLFVLFLFGLMIAAGQMIEHVDYPLVLSGILGIFLLAGAYAAIGLFMSSLTTHQVVAAISTFGVLFVLSFIGSLGQRIPFLSDLAYWLSISGRVEYLRQGLVTSNEVLYFLAIITLFLTFTYFKLSAGRKIESGLVKTSKYVVALFAIAVFGFVTSRPGLTLYLDLTREKAMTLSVGSQEVMSEFDGPWKTTTYANILTNNGSSFLPDNKNWFERSVFEQFWRENPDIKLEYVYYYGPSDNPFLYENNAGKNDEELAREFAYQRRYNFDTFLSVEEVSKLMDVEQEDFNNFYVVEWNGRRETLRNFADPGYFPSEREISAAIKRLQEGSVKLAYVMGHGERSAFRNRPADHYTAATQRDYRLSMRNQGFDVSEISLDQAVPADLDVLVIAAPEQPFSAEELRNLKAFIDRGGNLLVAGEPGRHDVLNPIVEGLGVEFLDGRVIEPKEEFSDELVFAGLAPGAEAYSFGAGRYIFDGSAVLTYAKGGPFEVAPILAANEGTTVLQTEAPIAIGDTALALAMHREVNGKEQRLMIMADADFMNRDAITRPAAPSSNQTFVLDMMGWLSNDRYPVDTSRPPFIDREIKIRLEQVDYLKVALYGVLPALLFLWGSSLLIIRRRK